MAEIQVSVTLPESLLRISRLLSLDAEIHRLLEVIRPLAEPRESLATDVAPYEEMRVEQTEHPFVVRVDGIPGGEPIIYGHRLPVRHVIESLRLGMSPEEYAERYSLTLAQVYDAIAYYHSHREEIEQFIESNKPETMAVEHGFTVHPQCFGVV